MLDQQVKDQVKNVFASLKNNYTFHITLSSSEEENKQLVELLEDVASCSDKINCDIQPGKELSFRILKNGDTTSVVFRLIPNGHEFTTLLLALLNLDGLGKNLPDEALIKRIQSLKNTLVLKSYVSLTCTNCPDVVQALNLISFYNPLITHEIIDGALHQQEVDRLNIQAVPSVYINDTLLHVGRSTLIELIQKIEVQTGVTYEPEKSTRSNIFDVVVVGGGPAGVSAAVYSARKGFSVALVAEKVGGQVTETVGIENMISIAKTTGTELSGNLKRHLQEYPVSIFENRQVVNVELENGIKKLTTSMGEVFETQAMIIATGASWRKLNVPGETQYIGAGVAFCTHCDGPFYKNKKVVVIGGGNSGLEAAIDLSAIASQVTVLEFMNELKGDKVLQDKLTQLTNVSVITGVETQKVLGDGQKVVGLEYKNRADGSLVTLETDGVFVQIGLTANSSVFKSILKTNRMGEIEIDAHCRTGIPGIYAAGDVSVVPYKQIVIAMGEGAKAALSAFEDKIKGKLLVPELETAEA